MGQANAAAPGATAHKTNTVASRLRYSDQASSTSISIAAPGYESGWAPSLSLSYWGVVVDRKQLLLRLAEEGHHALASSELARVAGDRRRRVALALERIPSLVDVDRLLSDEAWS